MNPEGVGAPLGAYSHAVTMRGGAATFVAGQVAVDIDGNLQGEDDLGRQTEVVFENLGRVLSAAGSSLGDVVKFTTFLIRRKTFRCSTKLGRGCLTLTSRSMYTRPILFSWCSVWCVLSF